MSQEQREVACHYFGELRLGLQEPPFPGALGEKIFHQISAEAWSSWLIAQTKFINEKRLNLCQLQHRIAVFEAMQSFLWRHPSNQKSVSESMSSQL